MPGRLLYKGSGCAMVTPFTKANTLDDAALREQAAFQLEQGTDALIVCGTTGEASTMSVAEQAAAIAAVLEMSKKRVPVIAGVGGNDTAKVIAACHMAKDVGADAALAVTPYYNKTTQKGLVAHFSAVAEASELPIILYNVPSRTGLNMKPETVEALASHGNIIGIKESSGDLAQVSEIVRRCGESFPVYSGNDEHTLPILAVGGVGVISVAANVVPGRMCALCQRFFSGKLDEARRIHLQLLPLIEALFAETSPSPVKEAMNMMGMKAGQVRLPLVPMQPDNRQKLEARLKELELFS